MQIFIFLFVLFIVFPAQAQDAPAQCLAEDRACILSRIQQESTKIETQAWRDQSYRELAKTFAHEGDYKQAFIILDQIETPDTKALTIRGIAMKAAEQNLKGDQYQQIFETLRSKADSISHPPSYAIALTYIAMAQAFAGDHQGAWATAASMENEALRHKAYAETAEIQAENGAFLQAMKSIGYIESATFRDKALELVSNIMATNEQFPQSLDAAEKISNPYKKAQALQYLLDIQSPRELEK